MGNVLIPQGFFRLFSIDRKVCSVKTINFRVTNGKGEMDRQTDFNAPFKYFCHIELTEGHVKEQYARDQVYCLKSSFSGTQTQHR